MVAMSQLANKKIMMAVLSILIFGSFSGYLLVHEQEYDNVRVEVYLTNYDKDSTGHHVDLLFNITNKNENTLRFSSVKLTIYEGNKPDNENVIFARTVDDMPTIAGGSTEPYSVHVDVANIDYEEVYVDLSGYYYISSNDGEHTRKDLDVETVVHLDVKP
jgi:hypothetical protein